MKTIGLIGGMSWESSLEYYRLINRAVREQLGGYHSAQCVLYSVDFAPIEEMQRQGRWQEMAEMLAEAARAVERAGAELFLLCTNTMHKVAAEIEAAVDIPFLHIADATGAAIEKEGISKVGLLGTRFTMEEPFYKDRLSAQYNLDVVLPGPEDRELVHRIIFEELVHGIVRSESRDAYREVMQRMTDDGAEGIILGCTEIGLLFPDGDGPAPLFDTTRLHAAAAVETATVRRAADTGNTD